MMVVVSVCDVPERLEGRLSRILVEVGAGLFVGQINARQKKLIDNMLSLQIKDGSAAIVWPIKNSAGGLAWCSYGNRRRHPKLIYGVVLSSFEG